MVLSQDLYRVVKGKALQLHAPPELPRILATRRTFVEDRPKSAHRRRSEVAHGQALSGASLCASKMSSTAAALSHEVVAA